MLGQKRGGSCVLWSQAGSFLGLTQLLWSHVGREEVADRALDVRGSARRLLLRCPVPCREKLVKVAVELLSAEVAEKALVVVTLRLLAMLMAKYDWRVAFATEGGVRAVLACMQQHAASALVQQAGLAVSVAGGRCRWAVRVQARPDVAGMPAALLTAVGLAGPEGAGGSCGLRARRCRWEALAPEPRRCADDAGDLCQHRLCLQRGLGEPA